jgi:hypothetical protein
MPEGIARTESREGNDSVQTLTWAILTKKSRECVRIFEKLKIGLIFEKATRFASSGRMPNLLMATSAEKLGNARKTDVLALPKYAQQAKRT